jgi:hypothetical protein
MVQLAPSAVYLPTPQLLHALTPSPPPTDTLPDGQPTQTVTDAYVPPVHVSQLPTPAVPSEPDTLPDGQSVQEPSPLSEYVPAGHETQTVAESLPSLPLYVPAGHWEQSARLSWRE